MSKPNPWVCALLCAAASALDGAPARAEESVAPATRWVNGSAVNLRAQASATADVVTRMALNTRVELIGRVDKSPYCEVSAAVADGRAVRGFTACEYLAAQPIDVRRITARWRDDGSPNPDYDPAKTFDLSPSWWALADYANFLNRTRLTEEQRNGPAMTGVRPDPLLERMKAHLAKGIYGPQQSPYADWGQLRREASTLMGTVATPTRAADLASRAQSLASRLGAWDVEYADERPEVVLNLVNAIDLPAVRPSLFTDQAEIGSPADGAIALSGRFHLIHTWRIRPRDAESYEGVWDVKNATASLVSPVITATLHRHGRIDSVQSLGQQTLPLHSELYDDPMCEGHEDGFAYGDAEAATWRYLYSELDEETKQNLPKRSPGSLLRFHVRKALPQVTAKVAVTKQSLDRPTTGFIRATTMQFDLDHDGEPDLAVWEGTGHGPGHLGPRTETDDAWLRLFFVNIAGQWKVLGSDRFSYGCGC